MGKLFGDQEIRTISWEDSQTEVTLTTWSSSFSIPTLRNSRSLPFVVVFFVVVTALLNEIDGYWRLGKCEENQLYVSATCAPRYTLIPFSPVSANLPTSSIPRSDLFLFIFLWLTSVPDPVIDVTTAKGPAWLTFLFENKQTENIIPLFFFLIKRSLFWKLRNLNIARK